MLWTRVFLVQTQVFPGRRVRGGLGPAWQWAPEALVRFGVTIPRLTAPGEPGTHPQGLPLAAGWRSLWLEGTCEGESSSLSATARAPSGRKGKIRGHSISEGGQGRGHKGVTALSPGCSVAGCERRRGSGHVRRWRACAEAAAGTHSEAGLPLCPQPSRASRPCRPTSRRTGWWWRGGTPLCTWTRGWWSGPPIWTPSPRPCAGRRWPGPGTGRSGEVATPPEEMRPFSLSPRPSRSPRREHGAST